MSRNAIVILLVVLVVGAVSLYAHLTLGYVCPLPWPDESHFVWPAISLAEHGTFISPELNPDRAIYWMPPGYMTALAGVFMIFSASLDTARWFSFACVLASFLFLLLIFRRLNLSYLSYAIAGWFYLNANFVACGNIARMEALLLAVVLFSFYLLYSQRTLVGIALLALTPLIHPNGFYFLLAGIAHVVLEYRLGDERPKFSKGAIVVFAGVVICWVLYGVQCASDWAAVKSDLAFQFSRKGERSIFTTLLSWDNLALGVTLILALLLGLYRNRNRLLLLGPAAAAWISYVVGFEMWYKVLWSLSALIVSVLLLESLTEFLSSRSSARRRVFQLGLVGLASIVVCGWHYFREDLELPVHYPYEMRFFEMSTPDGTPYILESDKQNVRGIIAAESSARPITVQFFPRAEALLYLDMRSPRVQFSDPLFYSRKPDLCVFHESKYLPPRWLRFLSSDMREVGLDPNDRARHVGFERDNHERWYIFKPR